MPASSSYLDFLSFFLFSFFSHLTQQSLCMNAKNWRASGMNGYDLLKKLGKGGMGTAFMVRRTLDNQIFALKQVRSPPSHPASASQALSTTSLSLVAHSLTLSHHSLACSLCLCLPLSLFVCLSLSLYMCESVSVWALFSLVLSLPLLAHASFICFFPVILGLWTQNLFHSERG